MRTFYRFIRFAITVWCCGMAAPALAQSPNTASLVVVVADSTGAPLTGADVSATSDAGLGARTSVSDAAGAATFTALPLAGVYRVSVKKTGFAHEDVADIILRAGETATVRVKLVAIGGTSEVTVYGTARGVRTDP